MFVSSDAAKHTLYNCAIAINLSVKHDDHYDGFIDNEITLKETICKGYYLPDLISGDGCGIELFEYMEYCIVYILDEQCFNQSTHQNTESVRSHKQKIDMESRKDFNRLYNNLSRGKEIETMSKLVRRLGFLVVNLGAYDNRTIFCKINNEMTTEYEGCNNYSTDLCEIISLLSYLNTYMKSRTLIDSGNGVD